MPPLKWPKLYRTTALILLLACVICAHSQSEPIVLGVLEDLLGLYAGDPNFPAVRTVFRKKDGKWQAFPTDCPDASCIAAEYPDRAMWTVTFDGKSLGNIMATNHKESLPYSQAGLQAIATGTAVPTVGTRSQDYSGFLSTPVFRPLITNSKPYFRDPDTWKPTPLEAEQVKGVRREFRKQFPKVTNCANPEESVLQDWPYQDQNIKILKSYSSKAKWRLAWVQLRENRCDGPADELFFDRWYLLNPSGEVRFLDQGMWLVDAGDYDNDGHSELVFSIDRYDRGGYELFFDNLSKHVTFEFGHH